MKLNQRELAARLNVTHEIVHRWESGKTIPIEEEMLKLSSELLVPVADIRSWANSGR